MKRVKLEDKELLVHTKAEEIFNMVSHIIGGAIGIAILTLCIIFAAIHKDGYALASGIVYGVSLILMYTMSSIYHGLKAESKAKKVFRVLDYCSIFVLIAGTYTPFILCILRKYNIVLGWIVFGIIWGLASIGIVLNSINLKKYRIFSIVDYLLIGVCILCRIDVIFKSIGIIGILMFILGAIFYIIGNIIYFLNKEYRWIHSICHIFSVIGSVLYGLCILLYVI